MRILYDGRVYDFSHSGGVARYFASLISRLPAGFMPFLTVRNPSYTDYPAHANLKVFKSLVFRPRSISGRLAKYYFRWSGAASRPDVIHPTYYSLLTQQEIAEIRPPVVITVWDMIDEIFSKQRDPKGSRAQEKRKAILAAQEIICISENTKKDLLERYPLPENKITVTHLASEIGQSLSYGPEPAPSKPYYLYVGGRDESYKNFDNLLSALNKAVSVRPELALCVVGAPFNDAENKLIAGLKLSGHIEHYGYVTNNHLAKLYRLSLGLVYPSLYEGFGIPLVEAFACGTAVIASNRSSIPEVVGDAALLFEPEATDRLADILLFLLDGHSERESLIAKGRERAKLFSWEKTAALTVEVYQKAVNK